MSARIQHGIVSGKEECGHLFSSQHPLEEADSGRVVDEDDQALLVAIGHREAPVFVERPRGTEILDGQTDGEIAEVRGDISETVSGCGIASCGLRVARLRVARLRGCGLRGCELRVASCEVASLRLIFVSKTPVRKAYLRGMSSSQLHLSHVAFDWLRPSVRTRDHFTASAADNSFTASFRSPFTFF